MKVLVDSDILIEVTRNRNREIVFQWRQLGQSDSSVLFSPVSAAELWRGARPSEHEITTELFLSLECAPIDYKIGKLAGEMQTRFMKSHNLELADALIAATAVQNGAVLWTRNRKHYPMPELAFF